MRFAIVGAGGLGCLFGGLLARAGEDVTLIARGANLAAIRAGGLQVRLLGAEPFHVSIPATDDPREVGPVDAIFLCVKTYDVEAAARQALPLIGPETLILPVQNGVEAADQIGAVVGSDHVVIGVGISAGNVERPGVVVQKALRNRARFGPDAATGGVRSGRVRDALEAAGIGADAGPGVERDLWEKLIFSTGGLGFMGLSRLSAGQVLASPEAADVFLRVAAEAEAVGRARGVDLPGGAAERALDFLRSIAAANPDARGSMYFDLLAGKRLELEAINGAVIRMGREHGIPTPYNEVVYGGLKPYIDGAPRSGTAPGQD
jgi:2-dehydropantoate 2-reductase